MGLSKIIQIPCHIVLANKNYLKLKNGAPLKQFFNINFGIGIIKKRYFFCSYFRHISLCFYSNFKRETLLDAEFNSTSSEYPHCMLLTDHATPKTRNTWKNVIITFFQVFLVFGVAGSVKSMQCRYLLDAESNSAFNELFRSKFE